MHGVEKFNKLIDHLIHQSSAFWPESDGLGSPQYLNDPVLDSHCDGAIKLIQSGEADPAVLEKILDDYSALCGNSLDAKDAVVDVIRVTARECGINESYARATNEYLRLMQQEMSIYNQRGQDDHAHRAFKRTRTYWEGVEFEVDPVAKATIYFEFAQTWLLRANRHPPIDAIQRVLVAISFFIKAADLLSETPEFQEYNMVCNGLSQLCNKITQNADKYRSQLGAAAVLPWLKSAVSGLKTARDFRGYADTALALSTALSEVRDGEAAEDVIHETIEFCGEKIPEDLLHKLKIQLAQSLSEQKKYLSSIEIQLEILKKIDQGSKKASESAVLYLGVGNCYLALGNFNDAADYYQKALNTIRAIKVDKPADLEAQICVVDAEVQLKLDNPELAVSQIERAGKYFSKQNSTIPLLQYQGRAAKLFFKMHRWDQCEKFIQKAEETLGEVLFYNREASTWETMLQEWHFLPALKAQITLQKNCGPLKRKMALISAETAKGRLMDLVRFEGLENATTLALSQKRRSNAIERIEKWCEEKQGRFVFSLFGTDNGLCIWVLGRKKKYQAEWIDHVRYQEFMKTVYEPWEHLMEVSGVDEATSEWAGSVTELLLLRMGEWLQRSCLEIQNGGSEIVISPHRLFRSLPWQHCELTGGKRLHDVFEKVIVVPSLVDFGDALGRSEKINIDLKWDAMVLADPEEDLPLSRLDGYSVIKKNVKIGNQVSITDTLAALAGHDAVIVSCHGDFMESSPWSSHLLLADGQLSLLRLLKHFGQKTIRAKIVVLGACEAGKNRRSLSDEAVGFPGLLIHAGVDTVLAPLWKVNDLASSLYVTEFTRHVMKCNNPVRANMHTAEWLRTLTVENVVTILKKMEEDLGEILQQGDDRYEPARHIVKQDLEWLTSRPDEERLFSARDWAAFQLVGFINQQ
ncbi:MAG: CHAT domain-containing protein [Thermodesulfobacteriota bacterium]|nr:CHAT domain-containing protein [Thermodesulfobacteriota bacterium]